MDNSISRPRFEEDYIERTYPSIVSDISIAFSELVANAWDAGASEVHISIPFIKDEAIIIEDNGSGMTNDEFHQRWMTFGYNRVTHQGQYVDFSPTKVKTKRIAYGRSGIGRHALFCFNNEYMVETWKDGICNIYTIRNNSGDTPFSLINTKTYGKTGNGTKLIVVAKKNLPEQRNILQTLGYRFLFDPEFTVYINNEQVKFENRINPVVTEIIQLKTIPNKITISIFNIPEGERATATNGIAFWSTGRLVGNPSWNIGDTRVEDARRKFALRHLIVVQADALIDNVFFDWSRYNNNTSVEEVFNAVIHFVRTFRTEYYKGKVRDVENEVIRGRIDQIQALPTHALSDLKCFVDEFLAKRPETDSDELDTIVSALLAVFQGQNGISLLEKLSNMNCAEVDTLNDILEKWTVSDIRDVLLEIDNRIKVIDAIELLSHDPKVDELHILHPLICEARWLFGIEYDSPHFTYNKSLTTVLEDLLKSQRNQTLEINWRKRPDLVIGNDFTLSSTCTEEVDDNEISFISKILIIELKKGGYCIDRKEVNQADEYIDLIYKGNALNCQPQQIKAYVVGDKVSASISTRKTLDNYGEIYVYTYQQLVQTASKRLFNLRARLSTRYEEMSINDYITKLLEEPNQTKMDIEKKV